MSVINGKNNITAEVLLGTDNPNGPPIYTLKLQFPRYILAAFSKHRMFSFNSASSRAVPIEKMIKLMEATPCEPMSWGKAQKGMSGGELNDAKLYGEYNYNGFTTEFTGQSKEKVWDEARTSAITYAKAFTDAGYHQEIVGRLLEPFQMIQIILTATDFDNFFKLRLASDAQSEIQELARAMKEAIDSYALEQPRQGWHLPMITDEELTKFTLDECANISAARAAVLSYYNYKGEALGVESATKIANHLLNNGGAPHLSPFEHQARILTEPELDLCDELTCTAIVETTYLPDGTYAPELIHKGLIKKKKDQLYYFGPLNSWISQRTLKEADYLVETDNL